MSRPYEPQLVESPRPTTMSFSEALGHELLARENFCEAEAAFRLAIGESPERDDLLVALANVFYLRDRFDEALELYCQAISADNSLADAHNGAGCCALSPREAARHFASAVQLEPECAIYRANFGTALAELSLTDRAVEQFMAAIELDPDTIEYTLAVAAILADAAQFSEAEFCLKGALAVKVDDLPTDGQCWTMYHMREFDRADGLFDKRTAREDAASAELLRMLAFVQLDRGHGEEAQRSMRAAVSLNHTAPHLHHDLAQVYDETAQPMFAATARTRATMLERKGKLVRSNLARWASAMMH